jgi:endonuclease/exonuclease/phosphatase (EEP) superfamily protein YafD
MTLNTKHGGEPPGDFQKQIVAITAAAPDILLLQEARYQHLARYVDALNAAMKTGAWHGEYARHCKAGADPDCRTLGDESVMILSRHPFGATERHLVWAADDFWAARAVLRAEVQLGDRDRVQVFTCHLPADPQFGAARRSWVGAFTSWAAEFAAPRLVGGDFNDGARSAAIAAMRAHYTDAWAAKGSGPGGTESEDDRTFPRRYDYFFSAALTVESARVPQVRVSDHRPLIVVYGIASSTGS